MTVKVRGLYRARVSGKDRMVRVLAIYIDQDNGWARCYLDAQSLGEATLTKNEQRRLETAKIRFKIEPADKPGCTLTLLRSAEDLKPAA